MAGPLARRFAHRHLPGECRPRAWRGREPWALDLSGAYSIFAFLGLVTFPLVVALGFPRLLDRRQAVALERLALHVALAGAPILAGGLLVQRRLGQEPDRMETPPRPFAPQA